MSVTDRWTDIIVRPRNLQQILRSDPHVDDFQNLMVLHLW